MRLAVVGWAGDSGVGRELIDAVRNLPVSCAFILDNPNKPTRKDLLVGTPSYFAQPANLDKQMELFIECHRPETLAEAKSLLKTWHCDQVGPYDFLFSAG